MTKGIHFLLPLAFAAGIVPSVVLAQSALVVDGEIQGDSSGDLVIETQITPMVEDNTVNTEIPGCGVSVVPIDEVLQRCGDADGCTFRMTLRSDNLLNASAPTTLLIRPDGGQWVVPAAFPASDTPSTGTNNDTIRETIGIFRGCWFADDRPGTLVQDLIWYNCNNDAVLFGPGPVSCTLRIDD